MSTISAVTALVARDLRAFRRSRSQLYSSVLFPLMLLAILGAGVSEGLDPRNVDDYTTFVAPGMVVMTALFSSTFSSASYYQDRDCGIFKVFLASPHPVRVILVGKTLSSVLIGGAQALLVLVIAAAVPAIDFDLSYGVAGSIAIAVVAIVLLNLFLSGVAQLLASRIGSMQGFHLVMNLVLFPLLFFSGAFFPLDELPAWLKLLAAINPLSYGVDLLRLALYNGDGDSFFGLPLDLAVMSALAAAAFWFGTGRHPDLDR
jgi:ABC-2 type transport system permease protein